MKTAIQQSIDKIKYFQDSTKNFDEKCAFAIAMDVLEDHKKTEKEYLENAIRHGWKAAFNPDSHSVDIDKYYNETFKPE